MLLHFRVFDFRERKKVYTKELYSSLETQLVCLFIDQENQAMPKYYPQKHNHYEVLSLVIWKTPSKNNL